jgi:Putative nuclear envelope organisation protein
LGYCVVYNAWHKIELEKWLDDHDIPYPAAADCKDLADFVAKHWDEVSTAIYETWEDNRLRTWLERRGIELDATAEKDVLIDQVKSNWYGAKANVESSWETVKDWIFNSYSPDSVYPDFLDGANRILKYSLINMESLVPNP